MISLIIPAWNAARTLGETLASAIGQSLPPDEIIVVDDGSTDETAVLAASAGARIVGQARQGQAAALNAGIAASRGDLLAFLDADDLWPAGKQAQQSELLAAEPTLDGVFGQMASFLCPTVPAEQAGRYRVASEPVPGWVLGALLIRRARFEAVGGFAADMPAGAFIDWFDRARRAGLRFVMTDQLALRRRIHPGSWSHRSPTRDAGYVQVARAAIARRRGETRPAGE